MPRDRRCALCGANVSVYIRDLPFCSNCASKIVDEWKTLTDLKQPSQPEHDAADVAKKLDAEVESARRRLKLVQKDFEEAVANAGHIAPHPDGQQHLRNVGREYRFAADALSWAMTRYSKFKTDGVIPEDLKE